MEKKISQTIKNLVNTFNTRNPFRIATELGAVILKVPLIRVNGFYHKCLGMDFIYLNEDLTEDESVLVCAHELGHLILHGDINALFLETYNQVTNKYEEEANAFAIQLLEDTLNLNTEIPLVDWSPDNYAIRKRITITKHDDCNS